MVERTFLFVLRSSNTKVDVSMSGGCHFPPAMRLRKRSEFVNLSGSGNKYVTRGGLVVWEPNSLGLARLGVTASKKVGGAVVRNRYKRYMREIFRANCYLLPPVDLNIIARREFVMMDFNSLKQEMLKAFRHIGVSICLKPLHFL
jgi:ribonuclease P protein component